MKQTITMTKQTLILVCLLILLVTFCIINVQTSSGELRIISMHVPARAELGKPVELRCDFDTKNQPLHAVKWLKNGHEFYRYTPAHKTYHQQTSSKLASANNKHAQRQAFASQGLIVDLNLSDANIVRLRHVSRAASGNFKCQVIVEDNFRSASDERRMEVVVANEQQLQQGLFFNRSNAARSAAATFATPMPLSVCLATSAIIIPTVALLLSYVT